uniref:Uncharacterized protein n=1 Tax=Arundo donax TaxID=35708 RepID=A0A0A9G4H0_ARUDO
MAHQITLGASSEDTRKQSGHLVHDVISLWHLEHFRGCSIFVRCSLTLKHFTLWSCRCLYRCKSM